jgi:ribosomal protein S18 acetylase RimI-like enzyme
VIEIRELASKDWMVWKALRLEALQNISEAFGSSFEEESIQPDKFFKDAILFNNIFVAFIEKQPVGIIVLGIESMLKKQHQGIIWGMYVKPQYQRQNIASALIDRAIEHAKSCVEQLHLDCVTTNDAAIKMYEKYGFNIYGTEPQSLKINNNFFDTYLMVKKL